jgi:hypothetical protein
MTYQSMEAAEFYQLIKFDMDIMGIYLRTFDSIQILSAWTIRSALKII